MGQIWICVHVDSSGQQLQQEERGRQSRNRFGDGKSSAQLGGKRNFRNIKPESFSYGVSVGSQLRKKKNHKYETKADNKKQMSTDRNSCWECQEWKELTIT